MIEGVEIKKLAVHTDDRGWLMEFINPKDKLAKDAGQITITETYPKVIKAFHYHKKQFDIWTVAKGMIQAVLYDDRPKSKTRGETQVVYLGEKNPVAVKIPAGVIHGYKVLGAQPALIIYYTSRSYDPKDEFRIPHDDPKIGFDWNTKHR